MERCPAEIWRTRRRCDAPPKNPQNDRLYVSDGVRKKDVAVKRLLCTWYTFSQSVMVLVGVSKLGRTGLIFLESRWMEPTTVTFSCCKKMLPDIRHIRRRVLHISAGQCSGTPGSWDDQSSWTPDSAFISPDLWPPNSPDLNPVDYKMRGLMCTATSLLDESAERGTIWGRVWLTCGIEWNKALLTMPLTGGADVSVHVFRPKENSLNIQCDLLISLIRTVKFVDNIQR